MSELPALYIQGVEVTQGVQHYRSKMHLYDPHDQAPDNSLRLVAYKAAWIRVYVRSGEQQSINNVTGTLTVERFRPEAVAFEISPQPPGTVTAVPEPLPESAPILSAQSLYRWERSNLQGTLNFVIPSAAMCGKLRLTAEISGNGGLSHKKIFDIDLTLHQHIHFRAILIGYNGPDNSGNPISVSPPTMAELQSASATALLMNPVSATAIYEQAGTLTLTKRLGPNGCDGDAGWAELGLKLLDAANNDKNKAGRVYYGLIANKAPGGGGCNWGAAAASFAGLPASIFGRVFAHEFGHFFQDHAPCGNPGGVDANYPAYEYYDPASTGEYGLDINNGRIMSPETYKDIMSYCPPNLWISPYGHKLRLNHLLLNPSTVCADALDSEPLIFYDPKFYIPDPKFGFVRAVQQPYIAVSGILDAAGRLEVRHVRRMTSYTRPGGAQTGLLALLTAEGGQTLASAPVLSLSGERDRPRGCGCDDETYQLRVVHAFLPDPGEGMMLRIIRDDEILWRRVAPAEPPRILNLTAEPLRDGRLSLDWQVESPDPDLLQYWVCWSNDDGENWNGLTTDVERAPAAVTLRGLPAGEVLIQIVAHDGFYSQPSEPILIEVPAQVPDITILHPTLEQPLHEGGTMRLWAATTGYGPDFEGDRYIWSVDGREVGRGLEAWTIAPAAGSHECTLRCSGNGWRAERTTQFTTAAPPQATHLP